MKIITKVIFRKWTHNGSVIAYFPELPADHNSGHCLSYERVGQHCAATAEAHPLTDAATPQDYAPLKRELELIGYSLLICKRFTGAMALKRRAAMGTKHQAAMLS